MTEVETAVQEHFLGKTRAFEAAPLHLAWLDLLHAHIRTQDLGDEYAAVSLLIVLDDGHPRPAHGQPAAIERVHELAALAAFGSIADVGPPCLEALKVGTRGDLAEESLARQPDLEVIGFGRAESQVSGAEQH